MDLLTNKMFTFPQQLAVQCSDKILMHINRPTNFQQTIDLSFEDFSEGKIALVMVLLSFL